MREGGRRTAVKAAAIALAATLAGGAGFTGYRMLRPLPLPEAEVRAARDALSLAHDVTAHDPRGTQAADSLGALLETAYARERSRLVRWRSAAELEALAAATHTAAQAAVREAQARRDAELDGGRRRFDRLAARLRTVAVGVETLPGERRLQRAYRDAELALAQASRLLQMNRPGPLAAALDSAESALSLAEARVDDHHARLRDPGLRKGWQALVDATVAETSGGRQAVVVEKLNRRCVLIKDRRAVAAWPAEFGRKGMQDKLYAGDGATPEGRYRVRAKNAASRYSLALLIDYPNAEDRARHARAQRDGRVPAGRGPGGVIEIHGHGGRGNDWTDGCIALRDDEIRELYARVDVGTPVTIVGAARLPGD
ncbi:MAG TPA: L,D-transpeptidase [Candidatus Krumholzibacteria bacterium]|nr:L,D-transpeptidase [Candidatus Krumholzibacteria bacterium]HRX52122.1 L,D-transpeptidase [Candidatus Krumholzibacteria bacterium]